MLTQNLLLFLLAGVFLSYHFSLNKFSYKSHNSKHEQHFWHHYVCLFSDLASQRLSPKSMSTCSVPCFCDLEGRWHGTSLEWLSHCQPTGLNSLFTFTFHFHLPTNMRMVYLLQAIHLWGNHKKHIPFLVLSYLIKSCALLSMKYLV